MRKRCGKCKKTRDIENFGFKNKAQGIRQPWCRKCQSLYTKAHYRENKDRYLSSIKASKERAIQRIRDAKAKPCADCGVEYPYYVMDFDHREDKVFNLAEGHKHGSRLVQLEIEKCDVVCANCHRERTHSRNVSHT